MSFSVQPNASKPTTADKCGKCELWDGDRLVVTATYRLQNGEVRLLDENGNTIYKGSYRLARDRRNISSLTLAGTTYYKM